MSAGVMRAVILAGGKGTRLAPYTVDFPKPLMPLGEMPILELLVRQLAKAGVTHITLAVGHLAMLIETFFGDGSKFGVSIDYSLEDQPLGTAGPLRLVRDLHEPFMVMNGDLLTDLDFRRMIDFHHRSGAAATLGLYDRTVKIDLGVIHTDDKDQVSEYVEKPIYHYQVSMGIYVLDPHVLSAIPPAGHFDLPDLVRDLIARGDLVKAYRHKGYWLDIGRPDDYQRARDEFGSMRDRVL